MNLDIVVQTKVKNISFEDAFVKGLEQQERIAREKKARNVGVEVPITTGTEVVQDGDHWSTTDIFPILTEKREKELPDPHALSTDKVEPGKPGTLITDDEIINDDIVKQNPGKVDEGLWEKAKDAAKAAKADNLYAFATYWYKEHGGKFH